MTVTSSFELEPVPAAVRLGRSAVQADATLADLPSNTRQDVTLIISELVSNAVAASTGSAPVRVEISRDTAQVVITVHNEGTMTVPDDVFVLPPAEDPQGRGLGIVSLLSRSVDVSNVDGITTVRAVVAILPEP